MEEISPGYLYIGRYLLLSVFFPEALFGDAMRFFLPLFLLLSACTGKSDDSAKDSAAQAE